MKKSKTSKPARRVDAKPAPLPAVMFMLKLETPDGPGYVDASPGNIDMISGRTYYQAKGAGPKSSGPDKPGRWIQTRAGNKLFVLATESNRKALGLPED